MDIRLPTRKRIDAYLQKNDHETIQTSLSAAQDTMFDVWECGDCLMEIQYIKKALRQSPLCADAYTYYCDISSEDTEKKKIYLENAVYAAEKALGIPIRKFEGYCWGMLETRPYMRARASLAATLWELGRYDESLMHYREMLDLNPNDNQGLRYLLLTNYLELEQTDEIENLFSLYPEDYSPYFLYTMALIAYRKNISSASGIAQQAISCNRHVPAYLSMRIKQPEKETGYITVGGKDEAVEYVNEHLLPWMRTPGAIDWLAEIYKKAGK